MTPKEEDDQFTRRGVSEVFDVHAGHHARNTSIPLRRSEGASERVCAALILSPERRPTHQYRQVEIRHCRQLPVTNREAREIGFKRGQSVLYLSHANC